MSDSVISLALRYNMLRQQDSAWRLLTAKRAPLILACAEQLFSSLHKSVSMEEAIELLAKSFDEFSHDSSMEISKDTYALAKQEWRGWLKRGLIVEKNNEVFATDALQNVIAFVKVLAEPTMMTSTASRLQTVQSEIQRVATVLNPNQQRREQALQQQILQLQQQLEQVRQGNFEPLSEREASESIENIYQLAMSLHNDFRRVEDSYRQMDRTLRENVIREQYHRGQVVAELLNSHEALINTPEGRVFQGFNQALQREELELLKYHIREILSYEVASTTLTQKQRSNFYYLTQLLNKEAGHVIHAKQRIEHDVRSFIQTELAVEHHRVGDLLKQVFNEALDMDWQSASLRQTPSNLPPLAINVDKINAIERLMVKEVKSEQALSLDLGINQTVDLADLDMTFWQALEGLDRQAWFKQTQQALQQANQPLTLSALAEILPLPEYYDMEAIAMWLEIARATGSAFTGAYEPLQRIQDGEIWQFTIPQVTLTAEQMQHLDLADI
ncbi:MULTISPECIES: DUF3375 family protein [unclassified Moraxella]|uniref:DUF3375 family protein n=1 Tax=unclassified Moraxella TaxID=2685852 RepID=UPI003AF83E84